MRVSFLPKPKFDSSIFSKINFKGKLNFWLSNFFRIFKLIYHMQDIGKKILFYINKIENNTIYITEILQSTNKTIRKNSEFLANLAENLEPSGSLSSASANSQALDYDSSGAAKYIIVVVLLYGFGIIFFIGSQVRSTQKYSDDVDGINAEKILKSMDTVIFTKEVLEKLSNKELREKAWKIYLTDSKTPGTGAEAGSEVKHLLSADVTKELDKEIMNSIEHKLKILNGQGEDKFEVINERKSRKAIKNTVYKKMSLEKKVKNKPAPMLILQTDIEGLEQLKESKIRSKYCDNVENEKCSLATLKSHNDDCDSVEFDSFEISEKITSL